MYLCLFDDNAQPQQRVAVQSNRMDGHTRPRAGKRCYRRMIKQNPLQNTIRTLTKGSIFSYKAYTFFLYQCIRTFCSVFEFTYYLYQFIVIQVLNRC